MFYQQSCQSIVEVDQFLWIFGLLAGQNKSFIDVTLQNFDGYFSFSDIF